MKLIQKLSEIPNDKLLHNFYGTCVYLLCSFVNPIFAITLTIIAAIAKEVYDELDYGKFDYKDILATIGLPLVMFIKDIT